MATLSGLSKNGADSVDLYIEEKELAMRIEEGLAKLPPKMREVFELSRIDELSYSEIAEKLNITKHLVKKQMSNALKII
ncbi:sigma-70 family RNA polymerase sigma factor [Sphingobacterium alkalisoli]|uniref:Sigma-70 family RNA polymerase sigma factor n=1 Tax=Sphingobacterium alkalisoli TaxID=1874115 RepID=A0A4U0H5Q9_9SPHI|nr:sigma-70 family RNA polymerase sigma factor [Sphingobacterium alkalisoli]TJY67091.1 sigma-70 family RNA polymerase sigma factor [Sphingobacterium alkalisoli]GGH12301.1 hypothetical protein GCM10011418_11730 [Sphingobacterium alkalisoli]